MLRRRSREWPLCACTSRLYYSGNSINESSQSATPSQMVRHLSDHFHSELPTSASPWQQIHQHKQQQGLRIL